MLKTRTFLETLLQILKEYFRAEYRQSAKNYKYELSSCCGGPVFWEKVFSLDGMFMVCSYCNNNLVWLPGELYYVSN
jgi:hypothetical protein